MTATQTAAEPITSTLEVAGATLTYDLRRAEASQSPTLMMLGSPMSAAGFMTLAAFFGDRTVVTYDPRGVDPSTRSDPMADVTPDIHADDIRAVLDAVGAGPVDLFATSGGAVNALALVARSPRHVRTLVAHEPPLASMVPDRDNAMAATKAIHATYQRSGWGAGMAHFIATVSHSGEFPDGFADQPPPDPAMFGMPAHDDGTRTDMLLGSNMVNCTHYVPDFDALRASSTRIVIAAGVGSMGEMANRGAFAVAERLGIEPVMFPSHHAGFLAGEFGQAGEPEAFAAKLREVLSGGD